jgi:hypothetical protein
MKYVFWSYIIISLICCSIIVARVLYLCWQDFTAPTFPIFDPSKEAIPQFEKMLHHIYPPKP